MHPVDYLLLFGILAIVGLVTAYLVRAKKKGITCIGCPDGAACAEKCSGCCANCPGCCSQHTH